MRRLLIAITVGLLPSLASAQQQVTIQTPFQGVRDSFYESFNLGWNFNFGNGVVASFNNNQFGGLPPFGGFNPGSGISTGMQIGAGDVSAGFNLDFSQGTRRSFVSQTPVITGIQGYPMFLRSGIQVPFVTGFTPVVGAGGFPLGGFGGPGVFSVPAPSLRERWEQARSQGLLDSKKESDGGGLQMRAEPQPQPRNAGLPLADALPPTRSERARGLQANASVVNVAAQQYFEKGQQAEADGKAGVAKIYYRMAAKRASGDFRNRIAARMKQLD